MSTETDGRRGSFVRIAGLTYGTNLAVAILSLLNVIITARSLGPTGRGEIALLTTIGPALSFLNIPPEWERAIQGAIILISAAASSPVWTRGRAVAA